MVNEEKNGDLKEMMQLVKIGKTFFNGNITYYDEDNGTEIDITAMSYVDNEITDNPKKAFIKINKSGVSECFFENKDGIVRIQFADDGVEQCRRFEPTFAGSKSEDVESDFSPLRQGDKKITLKQAKDAIKEVILLKSLHRNARKSNSLACSQ